MNFDMKSLRCSGSKHACSMSVDTGTLLRNFWQTTWGMTLSKYVTLSGIGCRAFQWRAVSTSADLTGNNHRRCDRNRKLAGGSDYARMHPRWRGRSAPASPLHRRQEHATRKKRDRKSKRYVQNLRNRHNEIVCRCWQHRKHTSTARVSLGHFRMMKSLSSAADKVSNF